MEMRGVAPRPLPFFYICTLNSTLIHPICHKNFRALSRRVVRLFLRYSLSGSLPFDSLLKNLRSKDLRFFMEMRGVEPLSARATTAVSTSVVCALDLAYPALTNKLIQSQKDKFPCLAILQLPSKYSAGRLSDPTSQNTWAERSLIKQRQLIYYC